MNSAIGNCVVEPGKVRYEKESATERFQKELCELQNGVKKFNEQLSRTKEVSQEAEEEIKRFQVRAERQCESIKMECAKERRILSKLEESEEITSRRLSDNRDATLSHEDDSMPEAARNAARYTTTQRIERYVKIGYVMFLDSVAAYALFKITKSFLLNSKRCI